MHTFYRFVVALGVTGLTFVSLSTGDVHGQNFAGTVVAEGNPDKAAQDINNPLILEPGPASSSQQEPSGDDRPQDSSADPILDLIRQSSHYSLGNTDILEIEVLRHPEVSGQYIINNEGNIQYEFIGDIQVEEKTKDQVRDILTERLADYIIAPEVTVKIVGYNSKIVYVIGEVGSPGKIFMRGDTITVQDALVQAGLPMLSAKTGDGRLITPSADGHPVERKVNVYKLLYKGDLRENLVMKPGDTLYVPPTFLAKTMRVLQPVAAPISTAAGAGRTVMTGF